jgi:hypothetical protein
MIAQVVDELFQLRYFLARHRTVVRRATRLSNSHVVIYRRDRQPTLGKLDSDRCIGYPASMGRSALALHPVGAHDPR